MNKKILRVLLAVMLCNILYAPTIFAQDKKDERTTTTRIADLLAQLPARDAAQLARNMKEVAGLGEDGYVTLISGLTAPNKGNNALIEYAVGGFTAFATKKDQQAAREMAVKAYCKVLPKLSDEQNKAFIISQFDLVGNDAAIGCLENYLTDQQLADEASRALAKIGTTNATAALINALQKANGKAKMAIVEALGHSHAKTAATAIGPLATGADKELVKVSLFALANIGDVSSKEVLIKAAEQTGYKYDQTNALAALLVYAQNSALTDKAGAENIAKTILAKATADDQVTQRIAALQLLSSIQGNQELLLSAMQDKQFEYRAAAVKFAGPGVNDNNSSAWLNQLKKVDAPTQVAILGMLANSSAKSALPEILKNIKSDDQQVKTAAVNAAVKLGGQDILDDLLKLMGKAGSADITTISEGILRIKGDAVTAKIAAYIPKSKPDVQVALINLLATRAATKQTAVVYGSLDSKNPEVRKAAFLALQHVSTAENKTQLFELLNKTTDQDELKAVQEAIIASVKGTADATVQTDAILQQMNNAPADKKILFYKVLAALGGPKALKSVSDAYATGNDTAKKAAIAALSSWSDAGSAGELINIARSTNNADFLNQAISGYLNLVRKGNYPAEQRLLLLRNAMAVAKTPAQQQQVLKDAEQAKCFNTIVFAGQYLDNPTLQQAAANAVMNITMAGTYNGDIVKDLLNKTIAVITGGDAGYQKEGMRKYISEMKPGEGYVKVFNGKDLSGWKGLVADPIKRSKMDAKTLADAQVKADAEAQESWKVVNGELQFQSHGNNLATVKKYGDFEMLVDWKIIDDKKGEGDAGIYLRGTPQVQIWDLARTKVGAQVGSGGLYNNQVNESKPLKVADNKLDEWNTFRILMKGDRVTVYLNGQLVTDNVILENYWDRSLPIFAEEQIELQAHGSPVAYRDIYIREIPRPKPFELSAQEKKEGYKILFDGTNMHSWTGNTTDYIIEDGNIAIRPKPGKGSGGNLFTKEEFSDFIYRFEFQLTPGANNGLGIRAPLEGDAAYVGMELQILDNDAPIYKDLKVYQYHGSIYGTIPAKRGFLKPTGEWNYEEVIAKGSKIKVILNGTVILDGDIEPFKKNGTPDHQEHPGLQRESGHIGFLGHGSPVQFRNIRIKDLSKKEADTTGKKK
ncbi:family 16 glycoside hydrolase [Pedobacter sp. UBA5917]|uniref:family 16 glycoside hydrolase n=1 Tax=Pedobacter sp. UBA5917 TaxID=1947061 RepID=UPI0025D1D5C2|nr:family 16 glycoside hydrolase [Pedobacter sp. UBA5917]